MGRPQASGIERGERCARYRGGMPRTLAVLTLACLLPSCGGEDRAGPPAPPPSPAETLLHALGGRVASGRGSSDASWAGDVNAVAMALWPIDGANPDPTALERHRLNANLSHVAGDVARQLAAAPGAREDLAARDPGSLAIHDAYVASTRGTAEAYAAWVATEGRALLDALAERRMRELAGDRPPR